MTDRAARTCVMTDCNRKALPWHNRCDSHVQVLIDAIFGPRRTEGKP